MATVKVMRPFIGNGAAYHPGDVAVIPDAALPSLGDRVKIIGLQDYLGGHLAETDRLGRRWPARFLLDLPEDDRAELRRLEQAIDQAVLNNNVDRLPGLLDDWRRMLLARLN